ncbi:hypothetical protein ABE85_05430 [Mitsuaria sp. 7]|nr:hypothetical protein ABE85_05430 [Mitsuaria sp. 7]
MATANPDHVSTGPAGPRSPDRRNDMLRHIPALLKRWQGADALLREMTWSHRTLRLVLQSPDRGGFLSIACIDPLYIQAPVSWSGADIEIAVDDVDGFLLVDAQAGVRIQTGNVEVKEFNRA